MPLRPYFPGISEEGDARGAGAGTAEGPAAKPESQGAKCINRAEESDRVQAADLRENAAIRRSARGKAPTGAK